MLDRHSPDTRALARAVGWLNSPALGAGDLRGRVALVDFWTYTCINWRRTLPWLRSWAEKYREHGLVVVGVHTPEFDFEEDIANVRRATMAQDVAYPVAIDSRYAIWEAFDNHYWPALYLFDAHGRVRHHQFGEGDYDQIEAIIVKLLAESGRALTVQQDKPPVGLGAEAPADWKNLRSPETYLGYSRSTGITADEFALDLAREYTVPAHLRLNQWALGGNWTMRSDAAVLARAGGTISMRFHARDLHLVMGPAPRDARIRFRVSLDGEPPGDSKGVDVDARGEGVIDQPRMYTLLRQTAAVTDRTFGIEFLDPGVEAYVFTFG